MKTKTSSQAKSALMKAGQMVFIFIQELRHLWMLPCPTRLRILQHVVPATFKLNGSKLKCKLQQDFALRLNLLKVYVGIQTKQRAPRSARKSNHQKERSLLAHNFFGTFSVSSIKEIESSLQGHGGASAMTTTSRFSTHPLSVGIHFTQQRSLRSQIHRRDEGLIHASFHISKPLRFQHFQHLLGRLRSQTPIMFMPLPSL